MKTIFVGLALLLASLSPFFAQGLPPFFMQSPALNIPRDAGIYVNNSAYTIDAANVPNLPAQSAYLTFNMLYNKSSDQTLPTIVSLSNDAPNLPADPLWIGWQATASAGRPNLIVQVSDGTNVNQFQAQNVGVFDNNNHNITALLRAHGSLTELVVVHDGQNLSGRVFNFRNNVSAGTTPLPPIAIPLITMTRGNKNYPNHFTFFNRANSNGDPIGAPGQFALVGHVANVFLHFASTTETSDPLTIASYFQNNMNMKAQQFFFYRDPNSGQLISYPYSTLFGEYNLVGPAGPFVPAFALAGPSGAGGFSYNAGLVPDAVTGEEQRTILSIPDGFTPPATSYLITPIDFEER